MILLSDIEISELYLRYIGFQMSKLLEMLLTEVNELNQVIFIIKVVFNSLLILFY